MDKEDEGNSIIEDLFRSRELYRILFENATEVFIFASDTQIIDCNIEALSLFGFGTKLDMIGRFLFDFSPELQSDGQQSSEKAKRLIEETIHKASLKFKWKYLKCNGIVFESEVSIHSFKYENQSYQKITIRELFQKREVEDELSKAKNLLQNVIDSVPQPLFVKDDQFTYTHCNQAFANYLGKSKEEIIGSTVFQISEPEKAIIYQKADIELFDSGEFQIYESKVKSTEAYDRDVIFKKNIIKNQENRKIGIIGIIDDVTEFKKNREELIQAEIKYKKMFENVQDVFYRTDLNGILTEISPSIKRYSKYVHHDIIGQPIENFYANPEDRKLLLKEISEKGEALDIIVQLKGLNNQLVWSSVNAHFFYDETGIVAGVEGTIRDITERKQTENKLKQSLSLLEATLDSTADGILVVSREGKITSYNKQFRQIFNLSDEVLETGGDSKAIEYVLNQLKDPELFVSKIQYLYNHPELDSLDTIELMDGRILERYSCPQLLDGEPIGRVWNFKDVTINKTAEKQMQLMAHTLRSINESISITDVNDQILFVNAAFLKTYGYTDERELIGQNIAIVRSTNNDPNILNQILDKTSENGWQGEILNKRKDGTEFPISLSTSVIKNENGETIALVGVAVDITDRKHAEKTLADKEAQLRTLLQTIPDLIWLKDVNGVYMTCNKMFEQFFGSPESEIIGKTDYDFVDKDLAELFRKNDQNAMKAGKPSINEEWITFASDGHKALLETIKMPMYNTKNEIIGVLGVGRDITYRKHSEEMLRQSETKYRNLIETMPDGVYRSTPEGKFIEVNDAMVKILGYDSKEDLMSIDIKTQLYFDSEERERLTKKLRINELDIFPLRKKDGSTVYIEDHGWFVADDNGKIIFHEGISRDVTQRKNAEVQLQLYAEQLKELVATKDKFFSIIAHDLKSPFNSILGLSEIIKNDAKHLDIATIEQYAGIIHSTSNNTFRLLENLLDWARIQQSQMPFQPISLVLKTLTNEVLEFLIEKANSKMIAIINYIPDNLIVMADKNMIRTILRNLISNALKFTSKNGKVEIKAFHSENKVEISIVDNGIGIKPEDIDKIFKIGSSFSKRGTENEKGTGLGLLLCKEFVEVHGGEIWVESEEGKGSSFKFSIPTTL
ncbi:MAG: PAS domain S-box protein [Prolixibacteraceae bacterium]|nr:PAS domain S-box protein [Prolixibacteraceae bacterium]